MNFVIKFHKIIVEKKIALIYEGEVSQEITKAFTVDDRKKSR